MSDSNRTSIPCFLGNPEKWSLHNLLCPLLESSHLRRKAELLLGCHVATLLESGGGQGEEQCSPANLPRGGRGGQKGRIQNPEYLRSPQTCFEGEGGEFLMKSTEPDFGFTLSWERQWGTCNCYYLKSPSVLGIPPKMNYLFNLMIVLSKQHKQRDNNSKKIFKFNWVMFLYNSHYFSKSS